MNSKVLINQEVLLKAIQIYEHLVTERATTNQSNTVDRNLIPIKNSIVKAIQNREEFVMNTQQTGELIVCLIVSLKIDHKKEDQKALLRELKHVKVNYVNNAFDENMAINYIKDIEKKLGYAA